MAIAERISCHCKACTILICISFNDWVGVSNSYSTYEHPGGFTDQGLEQVEQIREGSKDSELEGCLVKPLRCHRCKAALGLRCVEAPVEKITNVNRRYLKLTKLRMKSVTSGKYVGAKIKQWQNDVLKSNPTDPPACMPNLSPMSSQKHPTPQRREGEGKSTEAFSSDQTLDRTVALTGDLEPDVEEQRTDIDSIMAAVNLLQQDVISLRNSVENRGPQPSHGFDGDVDFLTGNITNVSSRSNELDALTLDMKIMQQRIKRLEESRLEIRRSSTVLESAQMSRQPSPTSAISPSEASSNRLLFPATQTLVSAHLGGLFTPHTIAFERDDEVNRESSYLQGLPLTSKAKTLPAQKRFNSRSGTPINGIVGSGSHTPKSMPPPRKSRKGPERKRRSLTVGKVATHRVTSALITGATNPTIFPRMVSQVQEASTGSCQNHQENPEYDDELVDDMRPQSSSQSSTPKPHEPASKTAHSHQDQTGKTAQQPPPDTQLHQNVPMPPRPFPPAPVPPACGSSTTNHDSKRRKTTASDANVSSTSIRTVDSRESRPGSGQREHQCLLVRINGKVDGKPARFQNLESKGRKRAREG